MRLRRPASIRRDSTRWRCRVLVPVRTSGSIARTRRPAAPWSPRRRRARLGKAALRAAPAGGSGVRCPCPGWGSAPAQPAPCCRSAATERRGKSCPYHVTRRCRRHLNWGQGRPLAASSSGCWWWQRALLRSSRGQRAALSLGRCSFQYIAQVKCAECRGFICSSSLCL